MAGDPVAAARALREPVGSPTNRRGTALSATARTVMVFTGQGSQYTGMAAGAYQAYPEFRAWLDRADTLLRDKLPAALLDCLFKPELADTLARTDVAAAAVVAVQLGLLRVLRRYGITPDTVLGHSVGEFCAAAASGAVSDEDALRLVARRGALMVERTRPGAMLAVRCSATAADGWDADAVAALADGTPGVCVAVHNSPRDLVLSGDTDAVTGLGSRLDAASLTCRRLRTSHAFHSELLAPMADDFAAAAELVTWSAPTGAQWISCSRGPMTEAPDARYWRDHLTEPVRFWDALALACADDRPTVLIEVGPHPVLLPLAGQLPTPPALVPVLTRDQGAAIAVAGAAAEAWCNGVPADLTGGIPGRRRHLPGYGFDRRVHSARPEPAQLAAVPAAHAVASTLGPAAPARPPREVLAGLWTDLLGVEPGPETSFLKCGGDSLILLRLQQRLQALLGTAPGLADLLDAGTFEAMALLLPAAVVSSTSAAVAVAESAEPATTYQASAVQQGMLMIDLMQPDSNQHNVTLAFEVPGRVDEAAMAAAFREAQARHSALRTVFTRDGGRFVPEIRPEPGARLGRWSRPARRAAVRSPTTSMPGMGPRGERSPGAVPRDRHPVAGHAGTRSGAEPARAHGAPRGLRRDVDGRDGGRTRRGLPPAPRRASPPGGTGTGPVPRTARLRHGRRGQPRVLAGPARRGAGHGATAHRPAAAEGARRLGRAVDVDAEQRAVRPGPGTRGQAQRDPVQHDARGLRDPAAPAQLRR